MIDSVFAVFDVKMNMFMSPYLGRNVGSAIRQFSDMCGNPNAPFSKHPEDYVLYEIGTFDVVTAKLESIAPHVVAKALDYVKQELVSH